MSRKMPLFSIRVSLVLVALTAVVPALVIILLTGREYQEDKKKMLYDQLRQKAILLAEIQRSVTKSSRKLLASMAGMPSFHNLDIAEMNAVLRRMLSANPEYLNFTVTDRKGIVIASARLRAGVDLSGRRHIRECLKTGFFVGGEYIRGRFGKIPAFPFSLPLRDRAGRIAAVFTAVFRLDSFRRVFNDLKLSRGSVLTILDHAGHRVFHYPLEKTKPVGSRLENGLWSRIRSGRDSGFHLPAGSDGVSRFYSWSKLRMKPGRTPYLYVVLGTPVSIVHEGISAITRRNLLLLVLVIVVALVFAFWFWFSMYRPTLNRVMTTVGGLTEGDFSVRTGIRTGVSELEKIGITLDRMAGALEEREVERRTHLEKLQKSMSEKEVLFKEIHHRVKNNLQLILSIINLQRQEERSIGEFTNALEGRVRAMATVHEMLYSRGFASSINLAEYLRTISSVFAGTIHFDLNLEEVEVMLDVAIPFGLVSNELITNVRKHTGESPEAKVSLVKKGKDIIFTVEDNGPGLPPDFSPETPHGMGMVLVRELIGQLHGELSWENPGGALFRIVFPDGQTG